VTQPNQSFQPTPGSAAEFGRRAYVVQSLNIEKLCNAFYPNAMPSELVGSQALKAVNRFSKKHGGLWVGGKVIATPDELSFAPNDMNVAFHVGLEEVHIPLSHIRSVRREFGWVTGMVVVEHRHGEFRFRCFGAKQVAAALSSHAAL
jgi:hypothetical protein